MVFVLHGRQVIFRLLHAITVGFQDGRDTAMSARVYPQR